MGMAASQARLLSLTARLHDIELNAQSIMSQKLALATQKDALYQEYNAALDATALKVAVYDSFGDKNYIDANYANLCGYVEGRKNQYALTDSRTGNLIVSEKVKEAYDGYGQDKYAFAYAMLGFSESFNWEDYASLNATGQDVGKIGCTYGSQEELGYIDEGDGTYSLYMTQCEQNVFENHQDDTDLMNLYEAIGNAEDKKAKQEALDAFRNELYKKYDSEIFKEMNKEKGASEDLYGYSGVEKEVFKGLEWDDIEEEFNHYVTLWSAINEAGGCQTIDPRFESGEDGTKWFQNMVESGMITIQMYNYSKKEWSDTSFATSTSNNHLQEVQDDKDLKKAEAKYEHELDIINRKDTKYDTELSKLETERTAITTEMDSIKKVKDDNIERTFGIFS